MEQIKINKMIPISGFIWDDDTGIYEVRHSEFLDNDISISFNLRVIIVCREIKGNWEVPTSYDCNPETINVSNIEVWLGNELVELDFTAEEKLEQEIIESLDIKL